MLNENEALHQPYLCLTNDISEKVMLCIYVVLMLFLLELHLPVIARHYVLSLSSYFTSRFETSESSP